MAKRTEQVDRSVWAVAGDDVTSPVTSGSFSLDFGRRELVCGGPDWESDDSAEDEYKKEDRN